MRVCSNCGSPDNGTGMCPNCKSNQFREIGTPVNSYSSDKDNRYAYQQQNNYNVSTANRSGQQNYQYDVFYGLPSNMSDFEKMTLNQTLNSANTLGTLALLFGILLSGGFVGVVLSIILGAISITKVNSLPVMPPNTPFEAKKAQQKQKVFWELFFPLCLRE